ncbi:putative high-affinity nitrate transporter [Helianthus annuus]|nr:putative high-affinity nitrate transporter [Helianthus annuus]
MEVPVPAGFLVVSLLLSCFIATSYGVYFSSLKETLEVTASPTKDQVLKAGEDTITVTWRFNQTYSAGTDSDYKTVKVKLCYAPISQKDRSWRKTEDRLKKDKTCPHKIVARPYAASNNSFTWTVEKDIPSGVYFVRVYALNAQDEEVAYGQNTDAHKVNNLFKIQAITGRHVSLDIASVCFSAFSIVSLAGFFYMEKRKGKSSQLK